MPCPAEELFAWHARSGALQRLLPPWENAKAISVPDGITDGQRVVFRARFGPFPFTWVAEHFDYFENRQFRDRQVRGPFKFWQHTHRMLAAGPDRSELEDHVEYELPLGAVGRLLQGAAVEQRLRQMFAFRHRTTTEDLAVHARYGRRKLRVLVTGASGLVGRMLCAFLSTGGHDVWQLTRNGAQPAPRQLAWNPAQGRLDAEQLAGFDAVVHLAGENIAGGSWSSRRKERIRSSRIDGTRLLAERLAASGQPPRVLVCASAIGYYGDRGDEQLDERSRGGQGFLADVVKHWEAAAQPAVAAGIRVVHLRFGAILSPLGGMLRKMLWPFSLGFGGTLGRGRAWLSWTSLDDALTAVLHAICTDDLAGPVNVVAPEPVTNKQFTQTLARVLARPAVLPVPTWALHAAFGELATELLLASQRVIARRLSLSGHLFRDPMLEPALRQMLGRADV